MTPTRAPEGRGAVAPEDGAHPDAKRRPHGGKDAAGNTGGGTTAPGPAAEPPGVPLSAVAMPSTIMMAMART
jgi:hypothetical protein